MEKFKTEKMGHIHVERGAENNQVIITVKDIRGPEPCPRGHTVGDTYVYPYDPSKEETGRAPPMCMAALNILYPTLRYLSLFGVPPQWIERAGGKRDGSVMMCMDVNVGVIFDIKLKK